MSAGQGQAAGRVVATRYRLRERAGDGPDGALWIADDSLLRREVWVRELRPPEGVSDAERAAWRHDALRRARAAARLDTAHVARIYDVVEEDGAVCVVLERLRGTGLADLLRVRRQLPPAEVARVGAAAADALAAAHAAGLACRVTPERVIRTDTGRVVVTDVGLDRAGPVAGGVAAPADDLWALGATLYAASHGRPPPGEAREPAGPGHVDTGAAGPLAGVIGALLATDPADRPGAVRVRAALAEIAADRATATIDPYPETDVRFATPAAAVALPPAALPPTAPPTPGRRSDTRDARERRRTATTVLVVAVVVVAAIVVAITGVPHDGPAPSAAERAAPAPATGHTGHTEHRPTAAPPPHSSASSGSAHRRASGRPGAVPPNWLTYTSPAGWSLAHPPGWSVATSTSGGQPVTDLTSPAGYLLRVNITPTPNPVPIDDWLGYEPEFASHVIGYRRLRLAALTVGSHPAADWEFVYQVGGVTMRALDREVRVGGTTYAVLFRAPAARWAAAAPVRSAAIGSFTATG